MFRIMQQVSSSGTGPANIVPTETNVSIDASNTVDLDMAPVPGHLERPLSALAAMAVDLGPSDLSTTFRKRRPH